MATAQHGAQNSQPGHTALTPFFCFASFAFCWNIYHPLDIQSNEFLASTHFNQKTKIAFCWWCFFWWIFRPLTMLINILTTWDEYFTINLNICDGYTSFYGSFCPSLLMDILAVEFWWKFYFWWILLDISEYLWKKLFFCGLFGPSLLIDNLAAEFWRIFNSQASTFELRAYFCIPCQTMLSLGNLKTYDITKRS